MIPSPVPRTLSVTRLYALLGKGGRCLRQPSPAVLGWALVPAVVGTLILAALLQAGLTAMVLPLAGGFLLVGPVALPVFLALQRGGSPAAAMTLLRAAPRGLWALSGVCALLFLIWISDAATVYSFMIGGNASPGASRLAWFLALTSVMGAVLALIVFCVSAFAVPLLLDRRASLVAAVTASVRAVFRSPLAMAYWALLLGAVGIVAALCPPVLLAALPWLAATGDLVYLEVFPLASRRQD